MVCEIRSNIMLGVLDDLSNHILYFEKAIFNELFSKIDRISIETTIEFISSSHF